MHWPPAAAVATASLTAILAVRHLARQRRHLRRLESAALLERERIRVLEQKLEHQALHDGLTGLPNAALLMDRLNGALARGIRRGGSCAVLFLGLDGFKKVNEGLGHLMGDWLLLEVAQRLDGCVRPEDTVARMGGDEFVVLLEQLDDTDHVQRVASRIADALEPAFTLNGEEVSMTASIGCAISTAVEDRAEDLVRDAEIALDCAKEAAPGRFELFEAHMGRRPMERLGLETGLRRALEREELELLYQPTVALGAGVVTGAEALIRWRHPDRGLVSPTDFIPLAEETGLILPMGKWVLEEACRTAASWDCAGRRLTVSVNLSARQFGRAELIDEIAGALTASGLEPQRLCLEITESAVMHEVGRALATMHEMKALGVRLALDDFGKGHSSLSAIKRFPLDVLKIDRSFVSAIPEDEDVEAIVATLIRLGSTLGMVVVAEGIETEFQLRRVRELGCDLGQGYHLARPMQAGRLDEILTAAATAVAGGGPLLDTGA